LREQLRGVFGCLHVHHMQYRQPARSRQYLLRDLSCWRVRLRRVYYHPVHWCVPPVPCSLRSSCCFVSLVFTSFLLSLQRVGTTATCVRMPPRAPHAVPATCSLKTIPVPRPVLLASTTMAHLRPSNALFVARVAQFVLPASRAPPVLTLSTAVLAGLVSIATVSATPRATTMRTRTPPL
jgi:hypothetical protein